LLFVPSVFDTGSSSMHSSGGRERLRLRGIYEPAVETLVCLSRIAPLVANYAIPPTSGMEMTRQLHRGTSRGSGLSVAVRGGGGFDYNGDEALKMAVQLVFVEPITWSRIRDS